MPFLVRANKIFPAGSRLVQSARVNDSRHLLRPRACCFLEQSPSQPHSSEFHSSFQTLFHVVDCKRKFVQEGKVTQRISRGAKCPWQPSFREHGTILPRQKNDGGGLSNQRGRDCRQGFLMRPLPRWMEGC